jgi:5-hydroxyisourate hydrolase-like protein (transthyretin family)
VVVTDVMRGRAAEGVVSVLEQSSGGRLVTIARGVSDSAGKIYVDHLPRPGIYRIVLDAEAYFTLSGVAPLLASMSVTFRVPETGGRCTLYAHISANSQFMALLSID